MFFSLSSWAVALIVFAVVGGATAAGYVLGSTLRQHQATVSEPFGVLQAAILGVVGLILAFGLSLAVGRYEARRVATVAEAFDRYLGESCGAYVPHTGASPQDVIGLVRAGGGIASLAHPGYTKQDAIIPQLVEAGLAAIEAYHSSHDPELTAHYLAVSKTFDLAVTGGSDYHGEGTRRSEFFGKTQLPQDEYLRFLERAGRTRESLAGR